MATSAPVSGAGGSAGATVAAAPTAGADGGVASATSAATTPLDKYELQTCLSEVGADSLAWDTATTTTTTHTRSPC